MALIKLKRGNKSAIPSSASAGEPIIALDTGELFYGNSAGTTVPVKVDKTNVILGTDLFLSAADKFKLDGISTSADAVTDSATNGNILINGVETNVYTHPPNHPAAMITSSVSGITGTEVQTILNNLKSYIDSSIQGLDIKASVKAATTANITLSGTQTIDGVAVAAGDRVLVKNQSTASQNGIYIVQSGAWTRATDFNSSSNITSGSFVFVEQGTVNADSGWVLTVDGAVTVGTTALYFSQFTGAGQITAGTGLTKSGNTLSIANTGVTAGTYTKVTVNAQGQATAGTTLAAADIPTLDINSKTSGNLGASRLSPFQIIKNSANGEFLQYNQTEDILQYSGSGPLSFAPASHVGAGGTAHSLAAPGTAHGFMSSTDKTRLDTLWAAIDGGTF